MTQTWKSGLPILIHCLRIKVWGAVKKTKLPQFRLQEDALFRC